MEVQAFTQSVFKVRDVVCENYKSISRAGVILVTRNKQGDVIYGMGIDRRHDEITDFGGGVKSSDRNFIAAAFREFTEETLDLIPNLSYADRNNSLCVIGKKLCFVFCSIDWDDYLNLLKRFRLAVQSNPNSENIGIISYTSEQMVKLLDNKGVREHRMYSRVIKELRPHFHMVDAILHG